MRPPREFSLRCGTIEASLWRCSELLPKVSPVFARTEAILGEISPTYASLLEVSLEMRPPREFSLEFSAIEVSLWRCGKLLPEVSSVYNRTEAILREIPPTYASLPEVSPEMRPPREFSLGSLPSRYHFGAVPNYFRRSLQYVLQKLLLGRSLPRTLPPMSSLAGLLSPIYLSGLLLIVVCATRFTRMPAGCMTGGVQGH